MQAAFLSSQLGSMPTASSAKLSDVERLAVLDDPAEWRLFSQPHDGESSAAAGLWESQVMVQGMHCAACALALERALLGLAGVVATQVSAASGRASVVWSAAQTRPSAWLAAPMALGYVLTPASSAQAPAHDRQQSRLVLWRWLVAGFCMMQVMMYAVPGYLAAPGDITPDIERLLRWASLLLSLPVVLFSCTPFFSNALRDLRKHTISMDLPVALGIVITFAVSAAATFAPSGWWGREVYFDSLTMFVFFLLTGRWLEQRLRDRTAGSLGRLMQRLPDSVERELAGGLFERVAVRHLVPGDLVRVLPGDAFPADGEIVSGDTHVDEALLTGESRPVARPVGARVLAGSHNLSSAVRVRVDQTGTATRYSQIVALMERASVDKPRLALLADRVARPFLWLVLLASGAAAAFWWSTDPARALMAAVAVLVVTCPCALSLATPTAMLTSAGALARRGLLVRRLQSLEALGQIDTVIFDKTGTLTEDRMGLQSVTTRGGVSTAQALQLARALAQYSLHPVSIALVMAAGDLPFDGSGGSPTPTVVDVTDVPGMGLQGTFLASPVPGCSGRLRLGSARFCDMQPAGIDVLQVCLADESGWIARFELDEVVRADAIAAVAAFQAAGVDVKMLSGDQTAAARRVAGRVGIADVQGDCTPQDKLQQLQALQQQGRKVLMVGDGLNDGPVLASAHVSVAVGTAVPLAQAQADFVMPGGQLLTLPAMLTQAGRTMQVVRQNLWWAAAYNAVCVPLALAGWLPAWLAGLGMACSSLLVIGNAARLSHMPRVPDVH
jgi:P-type Cu2+ transporter